MAKLPHIFVGIALLVCCVALPEAKVPIVTTGSDVLRASIQSSAGEFDPEQEGAIPEDDPSEELQASLQGWDVLNALQAEVREALEARAETEPDSVTAEASLHKLRPVLPNRDPDVVEALQAEAREAAEARAETLEATEVHGVEAEETIDALPTQGHSAPKPDTRGQSAAEAQRKLAAQLAIQTRAQTRDGSAAKVVAQGSEAEAQGSEAEAQGSEAEAQGSSGRLRLVGIIVGIALVVVVLVIPMFIYQRSRRGSSYGDDITEVHVRRGHSLVGHVKMPTKTVHAGPCGNCIGCFQNMGCLRVAGFHSGNLLGPPPMILEDEEPTGSDDDTPT